MIIQSELIIDTAPARAHIPLADGAQRAVASKGGQAVRNGISGQGSNSVNLRLFNERVILTALRRLGQASKADLARHAKLTNNTAGVIVRELEAQRLIRTEGKRSGQRGQPATLLSLNSNGAHAIGVKIGRRSIDTLLVDFCGLVLEQRRRERAFPLPDEAMALLLDDIAALRGAVPGSTAGRLAGLGVATPYHMGSWRRELDIPSEAYRAWNGFDIAGRLAAATGLPVFHENDGTAAAVAELFQGHGRRLNDFLYVFIGTAIGGGVILGGDYFRGVTGNAGDLGLMPVAPSTLATAPKPNRAFDILLTRASISSLIRHLRASGVPIERRHDLEVAIEDHPEPVREWLEDCAQALVGPLLSAACILDVEVVVLDGDLPSPLLADLVCRLRALLAEAAPESRAVPELRPGTVGREAAALGAAILPLHLNFSPSREILLGH
jgi:predicted NBD/HSP70 family sugar kinase